MKCKIIRILQVLLIAIILNNFFITAYCEQPLKTYSVDEVPLQITLPEKLMVFSRNIDAMDPNLDAAGLDKDALEQKYIDSNIYLNAISPNKKFEITLSVEETQYTNKIYNLNSVSESKVQAIRDAMLNTSEYYASCEVHDQKYAKFLKSVFYTAENHLLKASLDYYTIINGKSVNITLHSYSEEITQEQADFFESVIDNVKFTDIKPKPSFFKRFRVWILTIAILAVVGFGMVVSFKPLSKYLREKFESPSKDSVKKTKYDNGSMFQPIHPPDYEHKDDVHSIDINKAIDNFYYQEPNPKPIKTWYKPQNKVQEDLTSFLGIEIHYYN